MNIHNLKTVACYNSKLLLRSWMFRLFLLLLFLVVILFQLLTQTGIMGGVNSGLVTLSSYFPYENAHLFTMLQIVPLRGRWIRWTRFTIVRKVTRIT